MIRFAPPINLATGIFVALALSGCASFRFPDFGMSSKPAITVPAQVQQVMAADAAGRISTIFAPANTRFDFEQPTTDAFGPTLITNLRTRGFAVMEAATETGQAVDRRQGGLPVRYLVDSIGDMALYRVTVTAGTASMSRAYLVNAGAVQPAGAWMRKNNGN